MKGHRLRLFGALAAIVAIGVAGIIATPRLISSKNKSAGGSGGGGGEPYTPDRQITSGTYKSSVVGAYASPGAESRGLTAEVADKAKPPFAGWVNGIYIYPDATNAPAGFTPDAAAIEPTCPSQLRIVSEEELRSSGDYIELPAWMPPGAFEHEHIFASACGLKIAVVSRQFELKPYGAHIGILLRPWSKGVSFPATADRVKALTVNGMPAVLVAPLTDDGYGNSAIFIMTKRGLLQVGGLDVRPADLQAIAESIK